MSIILLIDDDPSYANLAKRYLSHAFPQADIRWLSSLTAAKEALSSLSRESIDLVVLDHHLVDGEGLDLLKSEKLEGLAVVAMSSDPNPSLIEEAVGAGAAYFLPKGKLSDPLFPYLLRGLIHHNRLVNDVTRIKMEAERMATVRTIVSTLQHEINNPLGAVMAGLYVLHNQDAPESDRMNAIRLIDHGAQRIRDAIKRLSEATRLDAEQKGPVKIFSVPD